MFNNCLDQLRQAFFSYLFMVETSSRKREGLLNKTSRFVECRESSAQHVEKKCNGEERKKNKKFTNWGLLKSDYFQQTSCDANPIILSDFI